MKIIIVLGSPNSPEGRLSETAELRLERALEELKKDETSRLLLTGGYGAHFNISDKPHYVHALKYVKERVSGDRVLEDFVSSSNTIEDMVLSKKIIDRILPESICIISSEFHIPRVKVIAEIIFGAGYRIEYAAACNPSGVDLNELKKHEERAIENIKLNGIRVNL